MEPRRLSLTVTPDLAGEKVDTLLRRKLRVSGTLIRRAKWLPDGILLDGVQVPVNRRVEAGQTLSILVGDLYPRDGIIPTEGILEIVYEDSDLLILNKAPGVPVHPGPGHYSDTIGNFTAYYYKKAGISAGYHPVHRLDRGTSGLMVIAKHAYAQEVLKNQLHTPAFRRIYLAVCQGVPLPASGVVDAPIGRVEGSLTARCVDPAGQSARTRYRVLKAGSGRSLVCLALETGRTHQIRVHMAHLGCPLMGDLLYGVESGLISRPALHSARLRLVHPVTGARMCWSLPLPPDMARLIPDGSPQSGQMQE